MLGVANVLSLLQDPDAELLHQTAEKCQESYERKHNKKPAAFGWDGMIVTERMPSARTNLVIIFAG